MLIATGPGYAPQRIKLEGGGMILGRCPSQIVEIPGHQNPLRLVKLTLTDGSGSLKLSRDHCKIQRSSSSSQEDDEVDVDQKENEKWMVYDLGSSNGVYVNGERVKKLVPTLLKVGSVVKLAKSSKPSFEYRFTNDLNETAPEFNERIVVPPDAVIEKEITLKASPPLADDAPTNHQHMNEEDDLKRIKQTLLALLRCPSCDQTIQRAACLPCGHVFCGSCVKKPVCSVCTTQLSQPIKGMASRCFPIDEIIDVLGLKVSNPSFYPHSNREEEEAEESKTLVWFRVKEPGEVQDDERDSEDEEDKLRESAKRMKQLHEKEKMEGRCEYCAEPAHERGMRCPHRTELADGDEDEDEASDLEDYA